MKLNGMECSLMENKYNHPIQIIDFPKEYSMIIFDIKNANQIVGLIRRSFSYLDGRSFVKLYTALVRPHLEYAQCVWSPNLKRHQDNLERVQERATKLVDHMNGIEYKERLKALNLSTLSFRRFRGDMIEMYQHFNKYDRSIICESF